MNKEFKLTTPILYLAFNRLDCVKDTFEEIKLAEPRQIFISCDGPRDEKEKEKTDAVRKYILDNINWDCEVKTLFRDKNLGCKHAVSNAITWFFNNVEQGIILEDDCLADESFFRFCQEMLEKYKYNDNISSITGQNIVHKYKIKDSITFSKHSFIWGWATWKKYWEGYNVEMLDVKNSNLSILEKHRTKKTIKDMNNGKTKTWDLQWELLNLKEGSLCVMPKNNLICNIGLLSNNYTNAEPNYFDKLVLIRRVSPMKFPLILPNEIIHNKSFDKRYFYQDAKRILFKKFFKMIRVDV